MFVVKLKYKDDEQVMYSNANVILPKKEVKDNWQIPKFCMPARQAKEIFSQLVDRNRHRSDWEKPLDYIALVELSNYIPHSEYEVVEYREFN
jgi:hypothetical protein